MYSTSFMTLLVLIVMSVMGDEDPDTDRILMGARAWGVGSLLSGLVLICLVRNKSSFEAPLGEGSETR